MQSFICKFKMENCNTGKSNSSAMDTATGTEDHKASPKPSGSGIASRPVPSGRSRTMWIIHICPTTGGQFHLPVYPEDCVENLKRYLSGKLKIPKERMSLLYKDR